MTKKHVLKCVCYAAALCSLQVGLATVSAEDDVTVSTQADTTQLTTTATEADSVDTSSDVSSAGDVDQNTTGTEADASTVVEDTGASVTEEAPADAPVAEESPAEAAATEETAEKALPTEFRTEFDTFDEATMAKADWWNGNPFGAVWKPENVKVENGIMTLTIDNGTDETAPVPFISGELRTQEFFHYGTYTISMKPIKNPGTVSSFFTYTGPSDDNPWDEVDIEFLGKDTTKIQFNYFTNGEGEHEFVYELGFDASEDFHTYAFDWQEDYITWYVDGVAVHTATENIPVTPGRIMMNAWPGTGVDDWLEPYDGTTPLVAYYDWMTYEATAPKPLSSEEPAEDDVTETPDNEEVPSEDDVTETPGNEEVPSGDDVTETPAEKDSEDKGNKNVETPAAEKEAPKAGDAKVAKSDDKELPSTGEKSGLMASLVGIVLLAGAAIFKPKRRKG